MFKPFLYAILLLIVLYFFLEFNNRRARRRGAVPQGRQSVRAKFVMKTIDVHNSANPDDILIFELDDHTRLSFSLENAQSDAWPVSCVGTLVYIAHGDKNEWVSFTPDPN